MRRLVLGLLLGLSACGPTDLAARWAQCEGLGFPNARIDACSDVIEADALPAERRAAALVIRGELRADSGQYARAVADFGRALRLDQTNASALLHRGMVHEDRGAFDNALSDYEAALSLDPALSLAAERRDGALMARAQQYRSQLDALTQALARDPLNAELLNNRCWIRAINNDDLDAALADCDASLRIDPANAPALDSRGLVRLKLGQYEAAVADYEAALAIEPGRGHFLYGRGLARLRLGMSAEGQADLMAAERAEPGIGQQYATYGVTPS